MLSECWWTMLHTVLCFLLSVLSFLIKSIDCPPSQRQGRHFFLIISDSSGRACYLCVKKPVQPWQQAALRCSFYHQEKRHSHVRTCRVFSNLRHAWPFCKAAICCYCRHANHCLLDPLNHVTLLSPNLNCRQRPCFVVTKCFFFSDVQSWFQETTL